MRNLQAYCLRKIPVIFSLNHQKLPMEVSVSSPKSLATHSDLMQAPFPVLAQQVT